MLRESHVAPVVAALGVTDIVSGWGGDELASFNGRAANRAIVRRLRVGALRGAYSDRRRRGLGPPGRLGDAAPRTPRLGAGRPRP